MITSSSSSSSSNVLLVNNNNNNKAAPAPTSVTVATPSSSAGGGASNNSFGADQGGDSASWSLSLTLMSERAQFIWGSGTVLLWLLTFLFVVGYSADASGLRVQHWSRRASVVDEGRDYWLGASSSFGPNMSLAIGLGKVGCNDTWAPLCDCLKSAVTGMAHSSATCVVGNGQAAVQRCFDVARRVQRIQVRESVNAGIRPYVVLLMLNTWAAIVGAVLLVRGKLADKSSYAVQLLFQGIILVLTLGTMWLSFGSSLTEWLTVLLVGLALVLLSGWCADDDQAWCAAEFHVMYLATFPTMLFLYNGYTHRLDLVYSMSTVALALALALHCAARMQFERVQQQMMPDNAVGWCNVFTGLLGVFMILLTYDETAPGILKSASYAWIVISTYISLSINPMRSVGQTFLTDLLLRAVLTTAMIIELFP
jgi:hypothetical protein